MKSFLIATAMAPLIMVGFPTAIATFCGLLVGFEKPSPVCNQSLSRIERVVFFIKPYACQKDAGILNPHFTDLIHWLGEVPSDK